MAEGIKQRAVTLLAFCVSLACADQLAGDQQCPTTGSCPAVNLGTEVPVIDIQALVNSHEHSSADWDTAAEAVTKACEEWGFFQCFAWLHVEKRSRRAWRWTMIGPRFSPGGLGWRRLPGWRLLAWMEALAQPWKSQTKLKIDAIGLRSRGILGASPRFEACQCPVYPSPGDLLRPSSRNPRFLLQAVNHGIPEALLDGVVAKGRELFSLPKAEKSKFERTATNARGWYDDELTKRTRDWKEGFDFGHVPDADLPPDDPNNVVQDGYNQWPGDIVPSFKETMDAFYSSAAQVAAHLLEGVASNLGLSREHFAPSFDPHTSYLRLNYYPPCPEPSTLSVNRHTDAGALTVLVQEKGTVALQVNHQRTGRWVSIPPVDGALTINVGDLLQVWTNDLFVAPEHRVLSQENRDRFSAPFFYNPAYHANVAPLPLNRGREAPGEADLQVDNDGGGAAAADRGGLERQERPHYQPLNWGEFRLQRFAGDFADQGKDEIQISHYRL
ncbi:unnamed protein product [Scytosiphon promiscuus]